MRRGQLFSLVFLALSACTVDTKVATRRLQPEPIDAGLPDASWGDFVATLPIPACPDGGVLLVDTLDDSLEGGVTLDDRSAAGATLSLREALFLAANTAGPHTIHFDPSLFPASTPGTITITDDTLLWPSVSDTCIDARSRGVVVDFHRPTPTSCVYGCMWALGPGSLMVGLETRGNASYLQVFRAQLAGNRMSAQQTVVDAQGESLIGPWNIISNSAFAIQVANGGFPAYPPARIVGNYIGIDPFTSQFEPVTYAVTDFGPMVMTDNVVQGSMSVLNFGRTDISNNRFLNHATSVGFGTITLQGTQAQFGPGNIVEASVILSSGSEDAGTYFVGNTFELYSGGGLAAFLSATQVGSVSGTCPAEGEVEVLTHRGRFWVPAGSTLCDATTEWTVASDHLISGAEVSTLFTSPRGTLTRAQSPTLTIP